MTGHRRTLLKATCFALSLTGATTVAAIVMTPDLAFAKNAKSQSASSNSQSSTQNGSKSQGAKSKDSTSGKSHGVQSSSKEQKSNGHGAKAPKSSKHGLGAHPSELGALNAAHANPNARLHASPNSRVGRVALYEKTVLAGRQLVVDRDAASDKLDGLDEPARPSGDVDTDRVDANTKLTKTNDDLSQLEIDIAAQEQADLDDGLDQDSQATLDLKDERGTLTETQTSLQNEIADLDAEYDAAVEYETAESDLKDLQDLVDAQPALETATLENAANKPVTPEVETAVKILLGLE